MAKKSSLGRYSQEYEDFLKEVERGTNEFRSPDALEGFRSYTAELKKINEQMHAFLNSRQVTDVLDERAKKLTYINKLLKIARGLENKGHFDGQAKDRLLKLLLKYQKELNDYDEQHSEELARIKEQYERIGKETDYIAKKRKEGVTIEERISHYLDSHLAGYAKISKGIGEIKKGVGEGVDLAKKFAEPWGRVDQAAADFTKHIGGSAKAMNELRSSTIQFVKAQSIGMKYNTSMEELIGLQSKYNIAVGRSVSLTNSQKESMAALNKVAGEQTAVDFVTKFERFGLSADEAGIAVGRMFDDASKRGVVFESYSKNFLDNIQLAQDYTFENGVRGLENMARKATEIRLDMRQAAAFANKVSTVEGAVNAGASLSVLGGSFAQFGNPLTMMYEGLNDIEGLQDRIVNMFGDLGRWDSKKGQVDVSAFNRQRIRAAAEATGMDYSAIMQMINTRGRANEIESQARGLGFTGDELTLLKNTAQLDAKGRAYVNVKGERKGIDELSMADMKVIRTTSVSDSDNIKTIAQTITGWDDTVKGFTKQMDAVKASFADSMGMQKLRETIMKVGADTSKIKLFVGLMAGAQGVSALGKIVNGGVNAIGGIGRGFTGAPIFSEAGIGQKMPNTPTPNGGGGGGAMGKFFGRKWGRTTLGRGLGGGVAAGLIGGGMTAYDEFANHPEHSNEIKWGKTIGSTVGGLLGGAVGMLGGPLVGMIGGAVGTWLGEKAGDLFYGSDEGRQNLKNEYGLSELHGDYSKGKLKKINDHITRGTPLGTGLVNELRENSDYDRVVKPMRERFVSMYGKARGGWITGRGTSTSDSIMTPTSNGEFVVNARSASVNPTLLSKINSSSSPVAPGLETMGALKVNPVTRPSVSEIRFSPMKIDMGGSIIVKNGGGNGSDVVIDADKILTPAFINKIQKAMQSQIERGFEKETFRGFKFM